MPCWLSHFSFANQADLPKGIFPFSSNLRQPLLSSFGKCKEKPGIPFWDWTPCLFPSKPDVKTLLRPKIGSKIHTKIAPKLPPKSAIKSIPKIKFYFQEFHTRFHRLVICDLLFHKKLLQMVQNIKLALMRPIHTVTQI